MILGSHNSLTYLDSTKWWLNMFYRCQDKTLKEQLRNGVRMIDIKVRFDHHSDLMVTNGKWESKMKWESKRFVEWLLTTIRSYRTSPDEEIYINITLDTDDVSYSQEMDFIMMSVQFRTQLGENENIYLIGGKRRFDDEKVIIHIPDVFIAFPVNTCSNQCRWYERWFPKMFARRNNELNRQLWKDQGCITAFDYI